MNNPQNYGNRYTSSESEEENSVLDSAEIIAQALPYKREYDGKTIVVKYGGNAMGDECLASAFASDISLIRHSNINPVIVHGGGPQIDEMLEKLGIESKFQSGLRITDQATVEVAEMVLAGRINKAIVQLINQEGGNAVGLSGKDGNMVIAEPLKKAVINEDSKSQENLDLGLVGYPSTVNTNILQLLMEKAYIPVIAPTASGNNGDTYNINADTFAGVIGRELKAKRLLFLTDVVGVLDKNGELISELTVSEAVELIKNGTISGGMIPKVETCIDAIQEGVEGVAILNGKKRHAVILELFTEGGAGTLITQKSSS